MIERLDEIIGEVDARIAMLMGGWKEDVRRISRVPGVAKVSAQAILAEIGDAKRFENGKKISSWAGLWPSVYQTADKNLTGQIKQGSKHLLRMRVQVAHAATRCKDSSLGSSILRLLLGVVRRRPLLPWPVRSYA
jgi:transposase